MHLSANIEPNSVTKDIVAKLWSFCHILRDDGITYQNYVTELTYLLFLKMLEETGKEDVLPQNYSWSKLHSLEGENQLTYYKQMLLDLGNSSSTEVSSIRVRTIFADAQTALRKPKNLKALTDAIDRLEWFVAREEGLGNLYEGLLEKNASEKKSGAGQYFTPRALIDCIIRVMKPKAGEVIQDPAAGTGGFLVAADHYIKSMTDDLYRLSEKEQYFQRTQAFTGLELVHDTHRLCLMNLMLHGIEDGVQGGDTLSPDGEALDKADLIVTNPPFGTKKGGGGPTRGDFSITANSNNKQLAFLEHIYRSLKPGGRAAVVLPDNVLFDDSVGLRLRSFLMDNCNVHTILRLPIGIFYAQTVQTNVLFFTKSNSQKLKTEGVWIYDMRTNMPSFGKTKKLTEHDFKDFEDCFGDDPLCGAEALSKRKSSEGGRFRYFTRKWIETENENKLDIQWLKDETATENFEPNVLAEKTISDLETALAEMQAILSEYNDLHIQKELPESWTMTSIGEVTLPVQQRIPDAEENFSYIDISSIDRDKKEISKTQEISGASAPSRARQMINSNDVLVSMTRPNLNAVAMVPNDLDGQIASTGFDVLRTNVIEPKWLYYIVRSEKFVTSMTDLVQGALYPAVRPKDIRNFQIPLAPLCEQERIVAKLDSIAERAASCKTRLESAMALIDKLTSASITKAYQGSLVSQDPADEPAADLLKQIKKKLEKLPNRKKLSSSKKR